MISSTFTKERQLHLHSSRILPTLKYFQLDFQPLIKVLKKITIPEKFMVYVYDGFPLLFMDSLEISIIYNFLKVSQYVRVVNFQIMFKSFMTEVPII